MAGFNPNTAGSSFALYGQQPPFAGKVLQVSGMVVLVGRERDCQVQINVDSVSRRHARFTYSNGTWFLEDLGSSNGTFLNSTPLIGQVPVSPGDIITFGTHAFQFQAQSAPQMEIAPQPAHFQSAPPPPAALQQSNRPKPARRPRRLLRGCLLVSLGLFACACITLFGLPFLGPYLPPEYAQYSDLPKLLADWWNGSITQDLPPIETLEPTGLIFTDTGFTVEASDGANVEFPPFYGEPDVVEAALEKISEPSGETTEYGKVVSGMYELTISAPEQVYSSLVASLPVDRSLIQGMAVSNLQPYALDQSTGEWIPVGTLLEYDEATGTLSFDIPFTTGETQETSSRGQLAARIFQAVRQTHQHKTQLRIEGSWFSSWVTTQSPDSKFVITYYPLKNYSAEVKNDEWWNSQTGFATNPDIPDYIEDLDAALNQAYAGLLQIPKLSAMLFTPLSEPIEVTVKNTGSAEGCVFLPLGTMSITNYTLDNYDEMRKVVGHELTHLLQDQYYNTFNAANNKWFFEATAEHFTMRANGFSSTQRGPYYQEGGVDYLKVPLTTSSEKNMYFVGHLLDWITTEYGETVIPTAIENGSYGTIFRDDLQYLEKGLSSHGFTGGIEEIYTAFGRYLVSHPDDYGGINGDLKGKLQNVAQTHISTQLPVFTDQVTFIQYSQKAPQLTMASILLVAKNTRSAKLVIDPSGSAGGKITAFTYAFPQRTNRDYTQPALDQAIAFPYAVPVSVPDFYVNGKNTLLEQSFTNAHRSEGGNIIVTYYLLVEPEVAVVEDGMVGWSNTGLGNIQRGYIQGYNVYRQGVRLNSSPIPDPGAGTFPVFNDKRIKAGDQIVVSVIDRYGNKWPEVVEVAAAPTPTPTLTQTPEGEEGIVLDGMLTETPDPFTGTSRLPIEIALNFPQIAGAEFNREFSTKDPEPYIYHDFWSFCTGDDGDLLQQGAHSTQYLATNTITRNPFVYELVEDFDSYPEDLYVSRYKDENIPVIVVSRPELTTYKTTANLDLVNKLISFTCEHKSVNQADPRNTEEQITTFTNLPFSEDFYPDDITAGISIRIEGSQVCNYISYQTSWTGVYWHTESELYDEEVEIIEEESWTSEKLVGCPADTVLEADITLVFVDLEILHETLYPDD
ncbi:MAG: FHA domain-containing protein [Anaerolineaceae bacterium]|nr:FHA domain-containing protein [Anaerolineaceae bacterium]